jgi:periplasmic protein TonB
VHSGLIAASVWGTLQPKVEKPASEREPVALVEFARFASVPERSGGAVARARGFQVLSVPAEVPATLPSIDQLAPATIPEDFSGRGVAGGFSGPVGGPSVSITPTGGNGEPIEGENADEPPYLLAGQMGPAYPDSLRSRSLDGLVVVRFVIDTLGRVERPTLDVLESTHPLFAASVRTALTRLRFLPARLSGRLVRVRMEQRFEFHFASR